MSGKKARLETSPAENGSYESGIGVFLLGYFRPPTEEGLNALAKTFEFTRAICYDVSGVQRTYQSLLQCPQLDVRVAADNFHGCRVLLPSDRSEGR